VTNLSKPRGAISDEDVMKFIAAAGELNCYGSFEDALKARPSHQTKNTNGIAIQIYATLIAYLILQLVDIPRLWGNKLLDKLQHLQACMCQEISYVHWMESILSG